MLLTILAFSSLLASAQFPASGVTCQGPIVPQGPVPSGNDLGFISGVWYVQTTFEGCNCNQNFCTQVIVGAPSSSFNQYSNLSYGFSYRKFDPIVGNLTTGNSGVLVPDNLDTQNPLDGPPFVLVLDLSFVGIPGVGIQKTNFFIIAAEKNNFDEITSLALYSCPQEGTLGDAQLFYWTRQPYYEAPSSWTSMDQKVRTAITTYNDFELLQVFQSEGSCFYNNYPTNGGQTAELVCDETFTMKVSNAAAWGSFLTLFLLIGLSAFICKGASGAEGNTNFQKMNS